MIKEIKKMDKSKLLIIIILSLILFLLICELTTIDECLWTKVNGDVCWWF